MTEQELKQLLVKSRENGFELPKEMDAYELATKMLSAIGSTDPVLRDELILELLLKIIEEGQLTKEQRKELLAECLGERHLFCGVGKIADDSVFNRTFTLLIIEAIMESNNQEEEPFLSTKEVLQVHKKLLEYARKEKDLRGYVEGKGWAHSSAHMADALNSLVHAKEIGQKELLQIMEIIRYKICDETYTYINNEEERLITTFTNIYDRKIVSVKQYVAWLNSFVNIEAEEKEPNLEHLRQNRKLFFRSLAYRVSKLKYESEIREAIDLILELRICR